MPYWHWLALGLLLILAELFIPSFSSDSVPCWSGDCSCSSISPELATLRLVTAVPPAPTFEGDKK